VKDNYSKILHFTLQWEGGFANDPHDPGGATMHGITQNTFNDYRRYKSEPLKFVGYINEDEVADIYRTRYWGPVDGDSLPSGVDLLGFDISVNSGPGRATQWLSQTSALPPQLRVVELDKLRRQFWKNLAIWKWFGAGWYRREDAALALAREMAR
jgi:lysozyme family protein